MGKNVEKVQKLGNDQPFFFILVKPVYMKLYLVRVRLCIILYYFTIIIMYKVFPQSQCIYT